MSEVKVNKISPRTNCGTVTVGDSGDSVSVSAGVPVTVNGDLKSNALKATDGGSIISQSGTTITLGASGDTIQLASGASQTGFGRTGTVDWDTTAKTTGFTAVSGNGYFVDTTSSAITVTLPASPSAGDIVSISDYGFNAFTNNITIARNGSNMAGFALDGTLETNGAAATLVYADGTKGWVAINDTTTGVVSQEFVAATGGTVTTCGNFKIHTFTGPGTFCVSSAGNAAGSNSVDYLVIAGGGGGGGSEAGNGAGGGGGAGGAGGYRYSATTYCAPGNSPVIGPGTALPVSVQGYPITVGGGGPRGASHPSTAASGSRGSNSVFSTITSTGGGGGGGCSASSSANPNGPGGSGGSNSGDSSAPSPYAGNTPPVSPPQGNPGGGATPNRTGGGGGGAAASNTGRDGGPGDSNSINGTPTARGAGGGGGGGNSNEPGGAGGPGGGGNGGTANGAGQQSPANPPGLQNGTANTGGGGGGAGAGYDGDGLGIGGSGIVIIRYKFQ